MLTKLKDYVFEVEEKKIKASEYKNSNELIEFNNQILN